MAWTDSEAGLKVKKLGGVTSGEGKCGDAVVERAARVRRILDILSVRKMQSCQQVKWMTLRRVMD